MLCARTALTAQSHARCAGGSGRESNRRPHVAPDGDSNDLQIRASQRRITAQLARSRSTCAALPCSTCAFARAWGADVLSIGAAGTANVQGEDQKKLDIISNDIMVDALKKCGKTAVLISEVRPGYVSFVASRAPSRWRCTVRTELEAHLGQEIDDPIIVEEKSRGRYCVVFDPLDGSSNIDAGVNMCVTSGGRADAAAAPSSASTA